MGGTSSPKRATGERGIVRDAVQRGYMDVDVLVVN